MIISIQKSIRISVILLAIISVGLFSCNLEPSHTKHTEPESSRTKILITLPDYRVLNTLKSKAVSGTSGHLYISTAINGNETNELYDPYQVDVATTITITNIPAGNYTDFIVLFSPKEIELETAITLGSQSHATIKDFLKNSASIKSFATLPITFSDGDLLNCFEGDESIGLVENVEIKLNQENKISVTLLPITKENISVTYDHNNADGNASFEVASPNKAQYIAFNDIKLNVGESIQISASGEAQLTAFDHKGKFISDAYEQKGNDTILDFTMGADADRLYISIIPAQENTTVTYYQRYTGEYDIEYNLNFEGGESYHKSYTEKDEEITLDVPPIREGYLFKGWYENNTLTGDPVSTIPQGSRGNKTFWAKWKKATASLEITIE